MDWIEHVMDAGSCPHQPLFHAHFQLNSEKYEYDQLLTSWTYTGLNFIVVLSYLWRFLQMRKCCCRIIAARNVYCSVQWRSICQITQIHSHLYFSGNKFCFCKKFFVFAQTGNYFRKQHFSLPLVGGKIRVLLMCSQHAKFSYKWFVSCWLPILALLRTSRDAVSSS